MKHNYIHRESRGIIDVSETDPPAPIIVCKGERWFCIHRVNVPEAHRRQGIASQLMYQVIQDADVERAHLWLVIVPSGTAPFEALADWYYRFGFVVLGSIPGLLGRMPNRLDAQ